MFVVRLDLAKEDDTATFFIGNDHLAQLTAIRRDISACFQAADRWRT